MGRYVNYNPDQNWLLPPSVREELGEGHLAVFVHELVEGLNLEQFEAEDSEQGRPGYPPELLLKVWLYAYALGLTSSRRLEQRIREDLGFRYLAGQWKPDHWTLNDFRRRHPRALNDVFTQVVETAGRWDWGSWAEWRSIRRACRRTPRRIEPPQANSCGESERAFGNGFDAGKSSAIRTAANRWVGIAKRWQAGNTGSRKFRNSLSNYANRGNSAVLAAIRRAATYGNGEASV